VNAAPIDCTVLLSFSKVRSNFFHNHLPSAPTYHSFFTMGLNNVRSGHGLLTRAGNCIEIPSVIPEFGNLPIIIAGYNFDQDDLDRHIPLLRYEHSDAWIDLLESGLRTAGERGSARTMTFGPADESWKVPKIHVSQGLRPSQPRPFLRDGDEEKSGAPVLAYIMVFQGRSGAFRSKLVLRTTLDQAGAEMFHMAANGFSLVFSGAMLKKNLEERKDINSNFKRVDNLDELQVVDSDQLEKVIGVLC
jgi:hypothetical protein